MRAEEAPAVAFMGSDAIGLPVAQALFADSRVHLAGVVSQPDRPSGRGQKLRPSPISNWAASNQVPLLHPEKPDSELMVWLQQQEVRLVVVMAYGHLLRKTLLAVPPCGFVNIHASILPAYRGASPIEGAIASGERETGVTLMRIVPAMDAGPVADVERVAISAHDTTPTLAVKLADAAAPLVERNLESLLEGTLSFREQDHEAATYTRIIRKSDGHVDFSQRAQAIVDRMRALDPWPGAFFDHGSNRLKVHGGVVLPDDRADTAPGTVLRVSDEGLEVAVGQGVVRFLRLQRPGGKLLEAADFFRGYAMEPGEILVGRQADPLVTGPGS